MDKAGIGTILTLIFVVLKLSNLGVVANWSWWYVFLPIIISVTLKTLYIGIAYAYFKYKEKQFNKWIGKMKYKMSFTEFLKQTRKWD